MKQFIHKFFKKLIKRTRTTRIFFQLHRRAHNPHIYAIADSAFHRMTSQSEDQCIVITGKSGSGKTQATHYLLHQTMKLCNRINNMRNVENMLSGCGSVLEVRLLRHSLSVVVFIISTKWINNVSTFENMISEYVSVLG